MYMYHQSTQIVKEDYSNMGVEPHSEMVIEFESDRITVNIPMAGIVIEGGWRIRPLAPPVVRYYTIMQILWLHNNHHFQVLKKVVDGYIYGKVIPVCRFSADVKLQEGESVPPLHYQVELLGAKLPNNIIVFYIDPAISGTVYLHLY